MTIDSVAYTYNADGSYTVSTSKEGKLASISEFDRTGNSLSRTDYEYKADGTYTVRAYKDGKMTQYVTFTAEGNEATRAVYTYNPMALTPLHCMKTAFCRTNKRAQRRML